MMMLHICRARHSKSAREGIHSHGQLETDMTPVAVVLSCRHSERGCALSTTAGRRGAGTSQSGSPVPRRAEQLLGSS